MKGWFVGGRDPETGDQLNAGEMASRLIQRVIRRWMFLGAITTITIYVWVIRDPIWYHSPADTWNYFLSWLAVAIESIVGMFFFAQAIRDAIVMRQTKAMVEKMEVLAEKTEQVAERVEQIARAVLGVVEALEGRQALPSGGQGNAASLASCTPDSTAGRSRRGSSGSRRKVDVPVGNGSSRASGARARRAGTSHE